MSQKRSDLPEISAEFNRRRPTYERLLEESVFILRGALEGRGIKYHSLPVRVKTLESFLGKIERKEENTDPFAAIHDVVGLRVVCLFLSDIKRVRQIITECFEIVSED